MSLLRDQSRKLQDRLEFFEVAKIFQDLGSPSSFGSGHVSHQTVIPFEVQKTQPRIENAAKYTRGYEYCRKCF